MPADLQAFIWWIFLLMVAICGFLLTRTLNKIDSNQTELFNRLHTVEGDVKELKGEHSAIMQLGGCKPK